MRDRDTLDYRADSGPAGAVDRFEVPSASLLDRGPPPRRSDLDSEETRKVFRWLWGFYLRELDIHSSARAEMAKDEDFYDSEQWDPEDRATLEARGQEALTINVIAQSINWVLGTERRGRTDFKVLPRRKEGSKAAERKSELLKYISDTSRGEFHNSWAFKECVTAGLGWLESGVQDDAEGEPIYERGETWRSIIWDSTAVEMDLEDGRAQFRTKWVDQESANAIFPGREHVISLASSGEHEYGGFMDSHGDEAMDAREEFREGTGTTQNSNDEFGDGHRSRLRLVEAWYKIPVKEKRIRGGDFAGEIYDPGSLGHTTSVNSGEAEIVSRLTYRVHVMIMTTAGPLWHSPSPYRHNKFPFTPIWAYRKARTGMPYGVVRNMRDAQKDINKRLSKALAIISSNKVIMDEGAVADLDEFAEEVSRPDAIIVKKVGTSIDLSVDRDLAAPHLQIMQMSVSMIQSLSGITDESMGRTTNATSGKAITARQEQGALATAPIFDNLRFARQVHGEKLLSLTEQFVTEAKSFRITNRRGQPTYVTVNDGLPENDIVRTKADFIISEDDWNATLRQAQVAALFELLAQLAPVAPQIVLALLDLVVEGMDVPSREEIVKRIRSLTGQEDPDADPNTQDPEREARNAAKQKQAEMEERAAIAQIETAEATAADKKASAAERMARTAKTGLETQKLISAAPGENIAQKLAALQAAIAMLQAEPAIDVADVLLQQARAETGAVQPQAQPLPAPPAGAATPQQQTVPQPAALDQGAFQ